jgi:tRNA threonylcarbamoyladenosine biosynthesis protein TsaB
MSTASPRILAIETSGRVGSVALARGAELLAEESFSHGMRHAVALLPTIARLCTDADWQPADIQDIYVSTGPGSFTGLRIAIAMARALAQALGCRLIAVNTLDVIAANAPVHIENLAVILDAKRGQVFAARYQRTPAPESPGLLRRVAGPVLANPQEFLAHTARPTAVMGEGVSYHRSALAAGGGPDLIELDPALWVPCAGTVHRLGYAAALRGEYIPLEKLTPVYIRLAEAEELWLKRHAADPQA